MVSNKNRIFVSYSHQNSDWAKKLRFHEDPRAIETASFWIDRNRLKPGDFWTDKVRDAIKAASAVVLLISKDFLSSEAVRKELRLILKRYRRDGLPVVFVPIGKLKLSQVREHLDIPKIGDLLSVPGWSESLHKRAKDERRSVEELRARIVTAATEALDVQSLRKALPGKYKLQKKLNHGPLARILLAKDTPLDRHVVIKMLHQRGANTLFRESVARVAKVPNHTNLMPVFEAYLDSDPPFYMLQYIDGESLRHLCGNEGSNGFTLSFVLSVMHQVGSGVSHAHRHGITGLNIKPSNIMVQDYDKPDLRTFYLSLSSYDEVNMTEKVDADDAYCPPERGGRASILTEIDSAIADQYRLGVLAYETLVGPRRFAQIAETVAAGGVGTSWPSIQDGCPDCLDFVARVVDRMVRRNPGRRFASISVALQKLDSDLQVEIVRASYRRLMKSEESQLDFCKTFYLCFQNEYPKSKEIFADRLGDLNDGQAESSGAWQKQFQALKEAVLLLVVYHAMGEEKRKPNILTRIAEQHAAINIPTALYDPFGKVLVETIMKKDQHSNVESDHLRAAWEEAISDGILFMKEETERIQAEEYRL
jgi:serine/threonine protein kinase